MDVAELMRVSILRYLKCTIHGTKISACILSTSAAVIEPDSFRPIIIKLLCAFDAVKRTE